MAETTTLKEYRIGQLRMKYLDLANISFAQQNYTMTKGYIDDFLGTILDESDEGKDIKKMFDEIMKRKKQQIDRLQMEISGMGYLEKKETEERGRTEIEINSLHDMKNVCWVTAINSGMFND